MIQNCADYENNASNPPQPMSASNEEEDQQYDFDEKEIDKQNEESFAQESLMNQSIYT